MMGWIAAGSPRQVCRVFTRRHLSRMTELVVGCRVRIQGLVGAPQHNVKEGSLVRFDEDKGRWGVKVEGEVLGVKPVNLVFVRAPNNWNQPKQGQMNWPNWAQRQMQTGQRERVPGMPVPNHWAHGLSEDDQREWLCDCYRMRMDDMYAWGGGELRGIMNPDATPTSVAIEFFTFCKLAVLAGAVPQPWDWSAFLTKSAGAVIYAFEKADAKERWGSENIFSAVLGGRSLRFTGEIIYGSSIQDPYSDENKEHIVEESVSSAFPKARGMAKNKAALDACADVGGLEAWTRFLALLEKTPGPNIHY